MIRRYKGKSLLKEPEAVEERTARVEDMLSSFRTQGLTHPTIRGILHGAIQMTMGRALQFSETQQITERVNSIAEMCLMDFRLAGFSEGTVNYRRPCIHVRLYDGSYDSVYLDELISAEFAEVRMTVPRPFTVSVSTATQVAQQEGYNMYTRRADAFPEVIRRYPDVREYLTSLTSFMYGRVDHEEIQNRYWPDPIRPFLPIRIAMDGDRALHFTFSDGSTGGMTYGFLQGATF